MNAQIETRVSELAMERLTKHELPRIALEGKISSKTSNFSGKFNRKRVAWVAGRQPTQLTRVGAVAHCRRRRCRPITPIIEVYYRSGCFNMQMVSATGEYDPAIKGFIINLHDRGGTLYHFGNVEVQSNIRAVDPVALQRVLRMHRGDIYMVTQSKRRSKTSPSR
jgi:hypothetical protein